MSELIPDNLIETLNYPPQCPHRDELARPNKPYEEYDADGNLIGYSWYQGDTIQLAFHIDGKINVENNAIVYTSYGDAPTVATEGIINQKAYNIVDLKSWTCQGQTATEYIWTLDTQFVNPSYTSRSYYISASTYLANKILHFKVLNYRRQIIFESKQTAASDIYFTISRENSLKIVKGTYTVELDCIDVDNIEKLAIIAGTDCQLYVR